MIKSLNIKNFKSHRDTKLDFSPGVNVILGRSQAGKTNVVRAFLLLSTNRPGGAKFFSNFGGDKGSTQIGVTLNDKTSIALTKDVQINKTGEKIVKGAKYTIDKGVLGNNAFEGFGASVPDVIKDKLNLSELNIQKQFDMPFLVMASASEIARTINRITKLEKVDQWISALTTMINTDNQKTKILEDETTELKKDLTKFKDIEKVEQYIQSVVNLTKEIEFLVIRKTKIQQTIKLLNKTNETITGIKKALEVEEIVNTIDKLNTEISRSVIIETKILELIDLERSITKGRIAITKIEPEIKAVEKLEDKIENLSDINYQINQYFEANDIYRTAADNYDKTKTDYVELLTKIGKCPLCWGEIDKLCIKRIVEEL